MDTLYSLLSIFPKEVSVAVISVSIAVFFQDILKVQLILNLKTKKCNFLIVGNIYYR